MKRIAQENNGKALLHPPPGPFCVCIAALRHCAYLRRCIEEGVSVWRPGAPNLCLPNNAAADMTGEYNEDDTFQCVDSRKVGKFIHFLFSSECWGAHSPSLREPGVDDVRA